MCWDVTARLGEISVPVLVAGGIRDRIFPPELVHATAAGFGCLTGWGCAWTDSGVQGGPVDEFLDVAVERSAAPDAAPGPDQGRDAGEDQRGQQHGRRKEERGTPIHRP